MTGHEHIVDTSYIVFKEDSKYLARNGKTGAIDYSGTNVDVVINGARSALSNGGNILLHLYGTHTVDSTIILEDNIVLQGLGWATELKAKNNLNNPVIATNYSATAHKGIVIKDLVVDGNNANQGDPYSYTLVGICLRDADDWFADHVYVHHAGSFGFWNCPGSADNYGGILSNSLFENNSWNGVQIGTGNGVGKTNYGTIVHDCTVRHSSDVGISVFGVNCYVSNCKVFDMDRTDGAANSQWSFAQEGDASSHTWFDHCLGDTAKKAFDVPSNGIGVRITNCRIIDISECAISIAGDYGHVSNTTCYDCDSDGQIVWLGGDFNQIDGLRIYNPATQMGAYERFLHIAGSDNIVKNFTLRDASGASNIVGIKIDGGDRNKVEDGKLETFGEGFLIDSDADNNKLREIYFKSCSTVGVSVENANCDANVIRECSFDGCSSNISNTGTNTHAWDNYDVDGNSWIAAINAPTGTRS